MSLIKFARAYLESRLLDKKFKISKVVQRDYGEPQGVFVVLKKRGKIRGSSGMVVTGWPLYKAVMEMVDIAAFTGIKKPLGKREVRQVKIEIYLIKDLVKFDKKVFAAGKDGLVVDYQGKTEMMMPWEMKRKSKDFLNKVCGELGFKKTAWKDPKCRIWQFKVDVLKE